MSKIIFNTDQILEPKHRLKLQEEICNEIGGKVLIIDGGLKVDRVIENNSTIDLNSDTDNGHHWPFSRITDSGLVGSIFLLCVTAIILFCIFTWFTLPLLLGDW